MPLRKVLHVIPSVSVHRGGPSFLVRSLARGLTHRGIEVHVATTNDDGVGKSEVVCGRPVTDDEVTFWYFPRQMRFYSFSLPLSRWLAHHIVDYDIVHIHALFSHSTTAASHWAHRRNVPYVVRPLGTLNHWGMQNRRRILKRASLQLIETRILKNAACVHYTSEQERSEANGLGVIGRSEIIPNTVSDSISFGKPGEFRSRYPHLRDRRIVLFLSRFDQKKGLDLLIPAFARARETHPEAALVLAGSGSPDFVASLQERIANLGIAEDVIWAGFLMGDDKRAALKDADVFVLPSYSENFGIAAAEAMTAGLPVIVSDQVAIHRDVVARHAGRAVCCHEDTLTQALIELIGNDSLRAAMRNNAICLAKEYTTERVISKLIAVYEGILR